MIKKIKKKVICLINKTLFKQYLSLKDERVTRTFNKLSDVLTKKEEQLNNHVEKQIDLSKIYHTRTTTESEKSNY